MNIHNIKTLTLAVAAIALAAPMTQAQTRRGVSRGSGYIGYNSTTGTTAAHYPLTGYNAVNHYAGNSYPYNGSNGVNNFTNGGYPANGYNAVTSAAGSGYSNYALGASGNYLSGTNGAYNNAPYFYGADPYSYGASGFVYPQGGAIVQGSDGQIYDPFSVDGSVNPYFSQNGVTVAAPFQLSDQIEAVKLSGNRVRIVWSGDPRPVASMKFSLLDSRRNELRTTVVNDLPAEAIFTRPSTAAYYRVVILYGDGATRSIVAAL